MAVSKRPARAWMKFSRPLKGTRGCLCHRSRRWNGGLLPGVPLARDWRFVRRRGRLRSRISSWEHPTPRRVSAGCLLVFSRRGDAKRKPEGLARVGSARQPAKVAKGSNCERKRHWPKGQNL